MSDGRRPPELDNGALLRFVYTCPLGILLVDDQGDIKILNARATALLIPYCVDGVLDNLFAFVARWDESAAAKLRDVVHASAPPDAPLVLRLRLSAPGRSDQWLAFHAVPFDKGLSVTCDDVSEVVKQEDELLRIATEEAMQRGRAELAAGILHDMGNALTGMGGQSVAMHAVLERDDIARNLDRLAEYLSEHEVELDGALGQGKGSGVTMLLRAIHKTHVQIRNELKDTLNVSNTYMGHAHELISINRTFASSTSASAAADLRQIVRDVRDMTRTALRARQGVLDVYLPDPVPRVAADRSKLIQILLNLLKNGIEAWDRDRTEPLHIEIRIDGSEDGGLLAEVRDNGCGFPGEQADSFFEPYTSTKERGSGFGLYSCRKLVENMGGRLTLHSQGPGQGATARLYLPSEMIIHERDSRVQLPCTGD